MNVHIKYFKKVMDLITVESKLIAKKNKVGDKFNKTIAILGAPTKAENGQRRKPTMIAGSVVDFIALCGYFLCGGALLVTYIEIDGSLGGISHMFFALSWIGLLIAVLMGVSGQYPPLSYWPYRLVLKIRRAALDKKWARYDAVLTDYRERHSSEYRHSCTELERALQGVDKALMRKAGRILMDGRVIERLEALEMDMSPLLRRELQLRLDDVCDKIADLPVNELKARKAGTEASVRTLL